MKAWIIVSILILGITFSLSAQTKIYPYRKGRLWGYCDANKKIIVQPVYNITYPYSDGLGMVINYDSAWKKYSYGFADTKGKLVIPLQFASAGFFTKERSIVKNGDGKFGVIDTKGKFVIEAIYNKIVFLSKSSLFKVTNYQGMVTLFDLQGKKLFDFKYMDIDDATTNLHAILGKDANGNQYCTWVDRNTGKEIPLKLAGAEEFSEGLAAARELNTNRVGYVNTKGEWVITPKYWMGKPFSDGIALISNSQNNTGYMYINKKGDTLFNKLGYKTAESFKEGVALVDYKFISKDGSPFLQQYDYCYEFRGGLAQVRKIGSNGNTPDWLLIDKTGKVLSQTPYSGGNFGYGEKGIVLKQQGWKYGVIDRNGKTIIEPKYTKLSYRNGMLCSTYQDRNYNDIIVGYITEAGVECWDE